MGRQVEFHHLARNLGEVDGITTFLDQALDAVDRFHIHLRRLASRRGAGVCIQFTTDLASVRRGRFRDARSLRRATLRSRLARLLIRDGVGADRINFVYHKF